MRSPSITIILLTYNEEKNLPACLASIRELVASVFVVDSFSTDATLSLLEAEGIRYEQHVFEHYAQQRNWAQENNPFQTDWVFHLDAGERLTPALVHWLQREFDPSSPYDGYMFSRKTLFFDHWIRYGGHYPNYHLRLYRKGKGHCEAKVYDQHFVCEGKVKVVAASADIIDTVADNLRDFTLSHSRWAIFEAVELLAAQQQSGEVKMKLLGTPIERRRWLKNKVFQQSPLFLRSLLYFIYRYFLRLGFLDGRVGLVFHFLQGFWFRFMVDAMVLELRYRMHQEQKTLRQILEAHYDPRLLKILDET
jgi:glycosyltransferase involved in cell wall biosynthesis